MGRLGDETLLNGIRCAAANIDSSLSEREAEILTDTLSLHNCVYLASRVRPHNRSVFMVKALSAVNKRALEERFKSCAPFFAEINNSDIKYALYKGAVLSAGAYGEPYFRKSSDFDLLIDKNDVHAVKEMLINSGFVQGRVRDDKIIPFTRGENIFHTSMTHQTAPFVLKTDSSLSPFVNIDINFNIMWSESINVIDMNSLLAETELLEFYGVAVKALPMCVDFVSVCLHHYKDANSIYQIYNGKLRLSLYSDIYFYIKNNHNKLPPESILNICKKLNVTEYVYHCVYHANLIFGDDILSPYLTALRTPLGDSLLSTYGLSAEDRRKWKMPFLDRLFASDFHERFIAELNENDIKSIEMNQKMMM